jgi:hypothetical protein
VIRLNFLSVGKVDAAAIADALLEPAMRTAC